MCPSHGGQQLAITRVKVCTSAVGLILESANNIDESFPSVSVAVHMLLGLSLFTMGVNATGT